MALHPTLPFQSNVLTNFSSVFDNNSVNPETGNQTMDENFHFEMSTEDKIILALLSLLGAFIIIANLTVLGLATRLSFLRVKPNYIIISLAVSDFFSGAAAIPLLVSCNSTFKEPLCIGMDVCQRFLAISTILHLATDVMNRYFRIVKPFLYRKSVTVNRLMLLILLLWAISLTYSLVQLVWISEKQLVFNSAIFAVLVFCPFIIIVSACVQMFRAIRQRMDFRGDSKKVNNIKRTERRALAVYGMMTFGFVIGWFPYFIMTILEDAGFIIILPYWLNITLLFLKYSTALADPLLYALMKTDFQKGLKNSFMARREEDDLYSIQLRLMGRRSSKYTSEITHNKDDSMVEKPI